MVIIKLILIPPALYFYFKIMRWLFVVNQISEEIELDFVENALLFVNKEDLIKILNDPIENSETKITAQRILKDKFKLELELKGNE